MRWCIGGPDEPHIAVYTLESADRPYRVLIEQIQEGAVTLGVDGTILYCNRRLALMLGLAQERITGQSLRPLVSEADRAAFDRLLGEARSGRDAARRAQPPRGGRHRRCRSPCRSACSPATRARGCSAAC